MLMRLPYSYESLIKIVLLIVLAVLLLNIYILSLIFSSEGTNHKRPKSINKDHEVKIKEEPLKKIRDIHDGKHAPKKAIFMQTNTTELATKKILQHVELLQRQFVGKLFSDKKKRTYQTLLDDLKISKPTSSDFLQDSMKWVNGRQLYPERTVPPLGQILNSLHVSHIERADVMPLGTQLKILLTLEGGLRAVFKPQCVRDPNPKTYCRNELTTEEKMEVEDVSENDSDDEWNDHNNLQDLVIEKDTSEQTPILSGRRIVDLEHVIREITELNKHGKYCTLGSYKLVKEIKLGLFTKLKFHCDNCNSDRTITSEPQEKAHELSDAFVWGSVSVGIGFSQAEEMLSIMDVPTMNPKRYRKHEIRIGKVWEETLIRKMAAHAEEEKKIAMEKGNLIYRESYATGNINELNKRIHQYDYLKHVTRLSLTEETKEVLFLFYMYPRTEVITGSVYAGKDRHNGEIAAFHFSWLLGLRRVPLTVGRKINLHQEIMSVASSDLLKTFYQEGNNTCFYGECLYCSPETGVCANQDVLEGALILWLPEDLPLKKFRHPWQRTYRDNVPARWELDAGYCQVVRKAETYSRGPRLLDIIDTAIFDFILGNGDRHHYEVFKNINSSAVLLIDNGKSFGNPYVDYIDILAPLYQCCRLRSTTYTRLLWLQTMSVGDTLRDMLQWSQISPVLTDEHFPALDRRVLKVIAAVHVCFKERNGKQNVIVDD